MEPEAEKVNNRNRMKKLGWVLVLLAVAAVLTGAYWVVVLRHRVTTDDAYVMADSARLSSRVPGSVLRVMVENDQPVTRGQVLVELDPRDYQAAVDQAAGALARIEAEIQATEISVSLTDTQKAAQLLETKAKLQETKEKKLEGRHKLEELQKKRVAANADLKKAGRDFKRYYSLLESGVVSEEQADRTRTNLVKAEAQIAAIDAELAAVRASIQASEQEVEQAQAQLQSAQGDLRQVEVLSHKLAALHGERQEARAKLEAAQLELSYCRITAPISGYIAQKNVQIGDHLQAGQPLMAVVPLQDIYVEANFKETQLENIRLGQPATFKADVYPNYTYHGKVVGIRAGTGASFSLLPPENATGNWIKVVQRVPVKIILDEPPSQDYPLRVGYSLHVTISTRDRSGRTLVPLASKP
jgi:membrane fusion protein (multidrug efflux system)